MKRRALQIAILLFSFCLIGGGIFRANQTIAEQLAHRLTVGMTGQQADVALGGDWADISHPRGL
jgi:hypothetical protein